MKNIHSKEYFVEHKESLNILRLSRIMSNLVERCSHQISGDCSGCRFDCLDTKKDSEGNIINYSKKNSQCEYYDIRTLPI